ncbi:MAG TPA: hypothetical protein VK470_13390 [Bacteroidota bacterium]|nr:hypothetical protein [Bacteroidota bacterium]
MRYPSYTYAIDALYTGSSLGNLHAFARLDAATNLEGLWSSMDDRFCLGRWKIDVLVDGNETRPVETVFFPESQITRYVAADTGSGADEVKIEKCFFIPALADESDAMNAAIYMIRIANNTDVQKEIVLHHMLTVPAVASPYFTKKPAADQIAKGFSIECDDRFCRIETTNNETERRRFGSLLPMTSCTVGDDRSTISAEYQIIIGAHATEVYEFSFTFASLGSNTRADDVPSGAELLEASREYYRTMIGRSQLITPDAQINRGMQWAAVNTARVQHRYRIGKAFTNDPPQDIVVLRDAAWYVLGSDYCSPAFSRELLECCLQYGIHENGKVTEYFHTNEEQPVRHDYGLNINDDTPLFVSGLWHYAMTQGGRAFLESAYGMMKRACDWILSQRKDGLVHCTSEETNVWGICGWRNIIDGVNLAGDVTEVNAECYHALFVTALAADALGEVDNAAYFRKQADALKETVNRILLDPASQLYALNRDRHGVLHRDVTGDLIFPLLFDLADEPVREKIISMLTSNEMWTPYGSRTVHPAEANYDPDFGYQLMGGLWPNLTAWIAYCIRKDRPVLLIEGMKNICSLCEPPEPKKFVNAAPGEFPERLHGETYESRGMAMSPWMPPTYIWLGIEGLFGVTPHLSGVKIDPAFPPEWRWCLLKNLAFRGGSITLFMYDGTLYSTMIVRSEYPVVVGTLVETTASDDAITAVAMDVGDRLVLLVHADSDVSGAVTLHTDRGPVDRFVTLHADEAMFDSF